MLLVVWPLSWMAFVPIVLIEGYIAERMLGLSYADALKLALKANAWSTLAGIPVTWLLLFVVGLLGGQLHDVLKPITGAEIGWLLTPLIIAWPFALRLPMVLLAAAGLCVPFYSPTPSKPPSAAPKIAPPSWPRPLSKKWWPALINRRKSVCAKVTKEVAGRDNLQRSMSRNQDDLQRQKIATVIGDQELRAAFDARRNDRPVLEIAWDRLQILPAARRTRFTALLTTRST